MLFCYEIVHASNSILYSIPYAMDIGCFAWRNCISPFVADGI